MIILNWHCWSKTSCNILAFIMIFFKTSGKFATLIRGNPNTKPFWNSFQVLLIRRSKLVGCFFFWWDISVSCRHQSCRSKSVSFISILSPTILSGKWLYLKGNYYCTGPIFHFHDYGRKGVFQWIFALSSIVKHNICQVRIWNDQSHRIHATGIFSYIWQKFSW